MKIQKLIPECKDYVWGGNKLKEAYGKISEKTLVAESWELSFHKDGLTKTENGLALTTQLTKEELGSNLSGFEFFPVLNKFIDAKQNLSVQVHPSDAYALKNENSFGKTEMWYIVEAEEGAGIYLGFNRDVTSEEYKRAIEQNKLTELLNFYKVKAGECYFIPAGTVHAIGAGCLIYEIQQNSNLTYRVYDYGRGRELHIEKALTVSNLNKHENITLKGEALGVSKYFTVTKLLCAQKRDLQTDGKTFHCVTVVKGEGKIEGLLVKKGDSLFVPANYGKYTLTGDMEVIMTQIRKYYLGIDLGGTFIKGGIVDDAGNIILQDSTPTEREKGGAAVAQNIASLCKKLLKQANMTESDVVGIGMGSPGMIDSKTGEVVYSNNLAWEHFSLADEVQKHISLPVKVANDANVAALGETKFGCGKNYNNTVMFTLGTGVGGGIIIDGKLFEGNRSAGAEIGHSVIVAGGEQCSCGRRGCLEAYASATALIRDTKRAMLAHKDSKMWEIGDIDSVTGKTAFDYKDSDIYAKEVVDNYIQKIGVGLTNAANVFRPEAIILGGGVCAQGDNLVKPLQEYLNKELYAGEKGPQVKILIATLGNSAGLLGAAALLIK